MCSPSLLGVPFDCKPILEHNTFIKGIWLIEITFYLQKNAQISQRFKLNVEAN